MGYIRNIIQNKGGVIYSVSPETFVYNALELMYDKNISAVLIIENDKPAGIFTERDYARKVVLKGKSSKETRIHEIMTKDLITVTPGNTIEEAMKIMTSKHIRHLPVVEESKLLGVVSIGDVVKFIIDEQQFIIGNLENYISHT
ncbi:MAG TPA: CBS domain-containing protein [Chitinophagaceae bacterium]|nr:CBS domain-containing protein [Chitinophagaceae bacterium]